MMDKYTPSPWLSDGLTIYALMHSGWKKGVEQFKNRFYCSVQRDKDCSLEEAAANAKLIAAAPDLLEALELSMKWLNNFHPDFELVSQWNEDVENMQSAIRKAKGE
jgi:hypothetical protein